MSLSQKWHTPRAVRPGARGKRWVPSGQKGPGVQGCYCRARVLSLRVWGLELGLRAFFNL